MTTSAARAASIAVVDDHKLFLAGFSLLLERLGRPCDVTTFDTPVPLLAAVSEGDAFDLVICDLLMNGMNGLAFVSALRSNSSVPVLMISGINNPPPIAEMRNVGAQGFVHKAADDDVLLDAIDCVLGGGLFFPEANASLSDVPTAKFGDVADVYGDGMGAVPTLTARQLEILRLISGGAANKEIARALDISENTVKTHLKQIFELLRVNKRTACVRAAQSLGIL